MNTSGLPVNAQNDIKIIEIPLNADWKPSGSYNNTASSYRNNSFVLNVNLRGSDSYAELFLDIRTINLPGIGKNSDGSYNLVGRQIGAIIISNNDFTGDQKHPNIVQFLLKNSKWESYNDLFSNVTDEMRKPNGMVVSHTIPNNNITSIVSGISIKFTIGSNSDDNYIGNFIIKKIYLK